MASRKQQKQRRRRAHEHTNRPKIEVPEAMLDDEMWLDQGRHYGLDLTDREQLLDAAAVGLTVLCWRNTRLEDVHAGVERDTRLERDGQDPQDPAVKKRERQARQQHRAALDAGWDDLATMDPDETRRLSRFLDGRKQGFGIPDDIMMRLNISTALDVRAALDEDLPGEVTDPGAVLAFDRRSTPEYVGGLVALLEDSDRELIVGGTSVTAAAVLGDTWGKYVEDVYEKIGPHIKYCDLLGARRAVWHIALSGVSYASAWFPNPWWGRAVDMLQRVVTGGPPSDAFHFADRATPAPPPADAFWDTLAERPALLNGPQCAWVGTTRLRAIIHQIRDSDRDEMQPRGEQLFGPFSALF